MAHSIVATTVKAGFKAYVRATRGAREALATVTEGWGDLVAEARHEREGKGERWIEVRQETYAAAAPPTPKPVEHPARRRRVQAQPADPEGLAGSTPVEEGRPAAEPQPTKAASPPDAAAGAMAHLPPEVRQKLAGDDPIRA